MSSSAVHTADHAVTRPSQRVILGSLAVFFFACHAAVHVALNQTEHILWACHIACLAVGFGLLASAQRLAALGTLILAVGVPLWLINLSLGAQFYLTSALSHFGGITIGFIGARKLGWSTTAWRDAATLGFFLVAISRYVLPADSNVNRAITGWPPLPHLMPSIVSVACMFLIWTCLLWLMDKGLTARFGAR